MRKKLFNFGLSDFDKDAEFSSNGWSSINSLYSIGTNKIPVKLVSCDNFMNLISDENIDLMKIDVEGSEYDMFDNFSDKNILRINKFIIEIHRVYNRNLSDIHNIINKLIKLGFSYIGDSWSENTYNLSDWRTIPNVLYFKNKNKKMKNNFYVHGTNEIVDLNQDAEIIRNAWANRFLSKYPESISYYEIYNREDYFKGDCRIQPGDVVVDCGGNIGLFTSVALDMGASRVLSFEPFSNNFELNKKNNPNAEVFNLAVSNKSDDTIELLYTSTGNGGHTIIASEMQREAPGHFEHRNIYVKTITLDDIISQNYLDHIDFLKVDTEGAELIIFEGLSDENLSKIRCIALEYHHNVFNYDDDVYSKFQSRFNRLGFNTFTWILDRFTRMLYINRGDVFIDNPNHNHK